MSTTTTPSPAAMRAAEASDPIHEAAMHLMAELNRKGSDTTDAEHELARALTAYFLARRIEQDAG